ncbi:MAG TPA: trigger factor [Rickettsiales bacterium]|nr:trigger factor [Rickettsiales bacterium]
MTEVKKVFDKELEKKFNIKIKSSELEKAIDEQSLEQQKKLKVDGFRKGKVPVEFIKNKYSALLLSESAEKLVEENVSKLIKENNLNLISRPKIDIKNLELGKDFEFEVSFELYPTIPEIKYNKISLKKQKVQVSKKDVEEGKSKLVKSKANWKEQGKEYKATSGDKVKIDFLGKIKDVPFEGGKAEGYELELGSKSFIDNFEDQLIGTKSGDKIDVKVKFPKEYHKKELAGEPAIFEVTVHSISTPEVPTLTDEFLKENFNIENVDKLEEMIEKELTSMYENATKNKLKNDIFEWMKKNIKIEMPKSILEEEFNRQWEPIENELKNNPNKFKNEKEKEKEKESIMQNAEDSIKLGLILSEIGKSNDIKVADSEIIEELKKIASTYPGQEQMIVDFYMKNKNALNQITGNLLEKKVIDFVIGKINLEEEILSAEDFIKNQK